MATVTIELPRLLESVYDGPLQFEMEAASVADAWRRIRANQPRLALHLFDEQHRLRTHVLCLLNDENAAWLEDPEQPLDDGARITFLQAVTGG